LQVILKSHQLNILKRTLLLILFVAMCDFVNAQINSAENTPSTNEATLQDSTPKLHLRKVFITGNKKTKDYIISREMQLKVGDSVSISSLNDELEKARQHIYNTTLFVEVTVEPVIINAFDFDININVKERWYIFPLPELQFVDGTINKWLVKYKGDLTRLNYGLKFTHYNLTGRKDQLRVHLLNGYTRTIYFNYNAPYSNPSLTNGFSVGGGYFQNREIAYKTGYDNNLLYYKKDNFVNNSWNIQLGYSIRKALKKSESFNLNYTHISIEDSIISAKYNGNYFNKPVSKMGYLDLSYNFNYTDVNNVLYPLTGFSGSFSLTKRGLGLSGGINLFAISGEYNKYWSLGKKWYASTQLQGNIKLPFHQAYINQQSFGYGNTYIRGMEYKIIDGVAYAISKFNLKRELFNFSVKTIFKKSKIFNKIPFKIYAKTFADLGYSYSDEEIKTQLSNTFLGSAGFGIDIVTFYDIQIRLEYSLNSLGQKSLFLHNEKGF
jgi:outer membrane protein assembly factor BamA